MGLGNDCNFSSSINQTLKQEQVSAVRAASSKTMEQSWIEQKDLSYK
jgi:hypothetical protein